MEGGGCTSLVRAAGCVAGKPFLFCFYGFRVLGVACLGTRVSVYSGRHAFASAWYLSKRWYLLVLVQVADKVNVFWPSWLQVEVGSDGRLATDCKQCFTLFLPFSVLASFALLFFTFLCLGICFTFFTFLFLGFICLSRMNTSRAVTTTVKTTSYITLYYVIVCYVMLCYVMLAPTVTNGLRACSTSTSISLSFSRRGSPSLQAKPRSLTPFLLSTHHNCPPSAARQNFSCNVCAACAGW